MDDRKLTVCYGRGNYKQAPPQIVLQGKWLEQTGFSAGDKITVKCQQGQRTKQGTIQRNKISVNPGNLLTAHFAPPLSCADVQEEATAGSAKPRR